MIKEQSYKSDSHFVFLAGIFLAFLVTAAITSLYWIVAIPFIFIIGTVIVILCRHAFYGFRFANINDAVSPFFRNHVNYSGMLVCVIPVLVAFYQLNNRFRVFTIALTGIALIALFLSYARGA